MGTTASAGAATAAAAAGACGPAPGSEGEAAAGGRPTAAKVMAGVATVGSAAGAGAGTTRRRGGDGAIPGRGGGDVIRRERPGVQQKREEGVAGINAIGNVGGEEGGGGEEGTAACVNLVQGVGWCAIRETMKRGVSVECNKFEEHNAERSDVKSGGEEQRVKVGVEGGTEGGEG